jgi:polyhydroxyalkanoate synthesis regulator phasin
MEIISKRGKPTVSPHPDTKEEEQFSIILVDAGSMTPEESRRAQDAIKEIRKHLDEIGRIIEDD